MTEILEPSPIGRGLGEGKCPGPPKVDPGASSERGTIVALVGGRCVHSSRS